MLQFQQNVRISAKEALEDEFFVIYHDEADEPESSERMDISRESHDPQKLESQSIGFWCPGAQFKLFI